MAIQDQENQPQRANCATPELSKKLTKRRSRESAEDVYEAHGQAGNAWLPKASQGAPFAWPLENVGEVVRATSKNVGGMVRETSKTVGCICCRSSEKVGSALATAKGVYATQLAAAKALYAARRRALTEQGTAGAAALRTHVSAAQAMTPAERRAAAGAAKRAATERVRATSWLERGLFACVCLLLVAVFSARSEVAALRAQPACAVGAVGIPGATGLSSLQEELELKDTMHKECLAEFQTHLDMMLGQYHLDKYSGVGRGSKLTEYADRVGERLRSLGMAPSFLPHLP